MRLQEMKEVKDLLRTTYDKIMRQDFYTGCGKEDCEWCQFVQEDIQPPSHTKENIEELDDL